MQFEKWKRQIRASDSPKYATLFAIIKHRIESGEMEAGMRLPTHRSLASALGVTVGVVARTYQELENEQLISGQVGRGTFVRAKGEEPEGGVLDLTLNCPPVGQIATKLNGIVSEIAISAPDSLVQYSRLPGLGRHCALFADMALKSGLECDPTQVAVTAGGHGAIVAAVNAFAKNAVVLTESHLFPRSRDILLHNGSRIVPLACDSDGIEPEALDRAIAKHKPEIALFNPTLHNPLLFTSSERRRRALGKILNAHEILLIEDDVYRGLSSEEPPPLSAYVDRFLYIRSFSKLLWPSARIGFAIASSADLYGEFLTGLSLTQVMPDPLKAEAICQLVESGRFDPLVESVRKEIRMRNALVSELPEALAVQSLPHALHFNAAVPESVGDDTGSRIITAGHLRFAPFSAFAPDPDANNAERRMRVSIGGQYDRDLFAGGLKILGALVVEHRGPGEEAFII